MRNLTLQNKYSTREMIFSTTLLKMLLSWKIWAGVLSIETIRLVTLPNSTGLPVVDVLNRGDIREYFELIIYLGALMILDLLTGVVKVWVKEKKVEAVTSTGLRETIVKFVQYGTFLIVTYILTHIKGKEGTEILADYQFTLRWATIFCILIEVKSVYENLTAMNKRLDFIKPFIDKLKALLSPNTQSTDGTNQERKD